MFNKKICFYDKNINLLSKTYDFSKNINLFNQGFDFIKDDKFASKNGKDVIFEEKKRVRY